MPWSPYSSDTCIWNPTIHKTLFILVVEKVLKSININLKNTLEITNSHKIRNWLSLVQFLNEILNKIPNPLTLLYCPLNILKFLCILCCTISMFNIPRNVVTDKEPSQNHYFSRETPLKYIIVTYMHALEWYPKGLLLYFNDTVYKHVHTTDTSHSRTKKQNGQTHPQCIPTHAPIACFEIFYSFVTVLVAAFVYFFPRVDSTFMPIKACISSWRSHNLIHN